MKKLIPLFGLLVLLLAFPANAQGTSTAGPFVDVGYDQMEFDYEAYSILAFGVKLPQNEVVHVEFRSFADLWLYADSIFIKFTPYPNETAPASNAYVELSCVGESGILNLSLLNNWIGAGWVWESLTMWTGSYNQTIRTSNEEHSFIQASISCNITARNQELFATFYGFYIGAGGTGLTCPDCDKYSIPNQAMADMMDRTSITISAAFDVFDLLLMVFALVIVIFIIVFLYRLFKSFVKPRSEI